MSIQPPQQQQVLPEAHVGLLLGISGGNLWGLTNGDQIETDGSRAYRSRVLILADCSLASSSI